MQAGEDTSSSERSEILGVCHLKRFWARRMAAFSGADLRAGEYEEALDNLLLNGLGLAIEETGEFLGTRPAFSDFERWVLNLNGGAIDGLRIERINSVVSGETYGAEIRNYLAEIDDVADVLSTGDLAYWNERGYVILASAISRDQARAAENAVWEYLGMARDDVSSWYRNPVGKGIMTGLYHHPALEANRASLRIRKAFAQLWKTNDLWVTTDRAGFNPPETAKYRFPGPRLHWDITLTPPFEFGTLGILYLCDTPAEQGAFTCIPGFHNRIEDWLKNLPDGADPRQEILKHPAKAIAANAGDLIVWHQALPHGGSPNQGTNPRIVQYMNMYPAECRKEKAWR